MVNEIVTVEQQQLSLGLPGTWTPTGWIAPGGLSFEDWEAIGPMLHAMEGAVHWWIGDWLNHGERKWGEKYAQAMDETGFEYETLRKDAWVAAKIETVRRRTVLSWSHHQEVAPLEPDEQDDWLRQAEENEWSTRELRRLIKQSKNGDKPPTGLYTIEDSIIVVGDARNMDLTQFPHRYGVIVADPPWPYRVAKGQGIAEDQYSVMTDADLRAMPVHSLAADDCVLFLWGTWPKLLEATQLMAAWGFEYVTGLPWVKTNSKNGQPFYGVGYWVRGCSEYVLIGRRGHVSPPRLEGFMGLLSPGFKHSRKPDSVHEIAETLPGPHLELFARRSRPAWTVFGNEIEELML